MNATVACIVEIMFQNTQMSDEVQALKDEVMNNCQERYQDMIDRGMDEDEAVAAVVDSLKGMEDVIAEYPRKGTAFPYDEDDEDDEETEQDLVFSAQQIKRVSVLLTSDDINFEASDDEYIHVYYDREDMPNLIVAANGSTLKIERDNKAEVRMEKNQPMESMDQEWNSFSDLMNGIKKMLGSIKVNCQYGGGGEVTIALPQEYAIGVEIRATSGDVDVDDVNLSEILVETTSGDVSITLDEDKQPASIRLKGSSGDVDVNASTPRLTINTVSGDVEYYGDCPDISMTTVSGDAEIDGAMRQVNLKSVSGDIGLRVESDTLQNVNCNTTSGDLTIHLPASLRGQVGVRMQTVSGSQHNRYGEAMGSPLAWVSAHSVSGDVTVC